MKNQKTISDWVLLISGFIILIFLFLGQMMSFINYEFTVSLGLQEPAEQIGNFGVIVNKGFGIGDTIIYIPLLMFGLFGFWKNIRSGYWALVAALGITIYWPAVCLSIVLLSEAIPEVIFANVISYIIILSLIAVYGAWGIRHLYKKYSF